MSLGKRCVAEFFGTFWLVMGGCGTAVLAAGVPQFGVGYAGVALAFGLTLLTMCYAIGHISGCHINPAVTCGLAAGGRFPAREVLPYIVAQVIGGIVAGGVLYLVASGKPGFDAAAGGFASVFIRVHPWLKNLRKKTTILGIVVRISRMEEFSSIRVIRVIRGSLSHPAAVNLLASHGRSSKPKSPWR